MSATGLESALLRGLGRHATNRLHGLPKERELLQREDLKSLLSTRLEPSLDLQLDCRRPAAQIGRYAQASSFKRMRKAVRTLRRRVSHVLREVARQLTSSRAGESQAQRLLARTGCILTQ